MGRAARGVGKSPAATQLELTLPEAPPSAPRASGLWEAVDALPEAVRLAHLRRQKLLKPRPEQAEAFQEEKQCPG